MANSTSAAGSGSVGMRMEPTVVCVVGIGKIGLPLAVQYARHGKRVIGCDIEPKVVEMINAGKSYVQGEPELVTGVSELVQAGLLSATVNTSEVVRQANVVVVIVPVDIDERHEVNFKAIDAATTAIGEGLQPGTLIIYETTLPVGTTAQRFAPMLGRAANLTAGEDFSLAYSPERVASGTIFRDLRLYPKLVGGIDEKSTASAIAFYESVLDARIIALTSTEEAEFVKLIETTYRDVNIALANEFARFADARGLSVTAAIAAANTQPYSHIHTPGVGVGGHCIPVYPYFLLTDMENREMHNSILPMLMLPRAARSINDAMAEYAVHRVEAAVGPLDGQAVLILGVTYRGDVRETAFSSAQLLREACLKCGAAVFVDDPLFSAHELRMLGYNPLIPEAESRIRAIILQADHQSYHSLDFSRFTNCRAVLDGRQALDSGKIELLGMRYITIGDGDHEKPKLQRGREVVTSVLTERGSKGCE